MAVIKTHGVTIKIVPYRRQTVTSNWIETKLAIEYHIQEQHIKIQCPSDDIYLRVEDYKRLIMGVREHISILPIEPTFSPVKEFHFTPMEPSFELDVGSGLFDDELRQDGIVSVHFKLGLRTLGVEELMGDQLGCIVEMRIQKLLDFLLVLEQEVSGLVDK